MQYIMRKCALQALRAGEKKEFMVYLDNAATTMPCREACEAVVSAAGGRFGNPSSLHRMGIMSEQTIASAKRTLLAALGSSPKEKGSTAFEGDVIFTSGATESNNTALLSVCELYGRNGSRIVSTAMEHPSVARVLDRLAERGFEVTRLAPNDYEDFEQALADAVDENTLLVSCMAVNNETGYTVDVRRLYKLVKRKNSKTLVHIDAVQGFLKVPLDGDLISVSGHKLHALKGIGALFIRKGIRVAPLLLGGGQQKGLRSGTEAVELIAGFEAAVRAYRGDRERFSALKRRLLDRLSDMSGISLNSTDKCYPSIVNFSVSGVRSEIMLHSLEEKEIYVSSGSACSKGKKSGVLAALGVSDKDADCAVRVSLCADTTEEDIDFLCENIAKGIERFRR